MFSIIQENELITLILACCVLVFIVIKRSQLRCIPFSEILIFAYSVLLTGWVVTILESFFFGQAMNVLEHFCYALSTAIMAFWCFKFFYSGRKIE